MKKGVIFYISIFFVLIFAFKTYANPLPKTITIFHAGSLSIPFKILTQEYMKIHKNIRSALESSGSVSAIRKITELKKSADILGSADASLIERMMFPDYAKWYVEFATNEMVIAYRDNAPYSNIINKDNWFQILLKEDVEYGHSDPNMDPCGYRTLLLWKLSEIYYKKPGLYNKLVKNCPPKNIRPKEVDLIALLETKNLDYAFEYRSVAIQHHLKYVELPDKINLGNVKFKDFYKMVDIEIIGKSPGTKLKITGKPIVYGMTIPILAKNKKEAKDFIKFILSEEGRKLIRKSGQKPINPPIFIGAYED